MGDRSAVDVPAVPEGYDEDLARGIVYLVNRSIVAYPDPPPFPTLELAGAGRARFARESLKAFLDTILNVRGQPGYLFLRSPLDDYGVAHQSPVTLPSLISRMACSRGMASSPSLLIAAFASS